MPRQPGDELPREGRLADAGFTNDRHATRLAVRKDGRECALQRLELGLPTDEHRARPPDIGPRPNESSADDAAGLSLRRDRHRLAELERAPRGDGCAFTDEDLASSRGLLEARRDVDGIAGDERAADARLADDDVTRVDPDAQRKRVAE